MATHAAVFVLHILETIKLRVLRRIEQNMRVERIAVGKLGARKASGTERGADVGEND